MRVKVKARRNVHNSKATHSSYTMWRPSYTIENMQWEINPYDDDDFPSVPHADSIAPYHLYKIDLLDGIGTIYCNRERYGHIRKKDYNRLMKDIRKRSLIKIARNYYREQHPYINLPVIDEEKRAISKSYSMLMRRKASRYIFACKCIKEN